MEQTLSKNGLAIALSLVVIFGLRWISQHWHAKAEIVTESSYSYEMLRPKSYVGGFNLSGREIDREILTDEEIKALAKAQNKTPEEIKKELAAKKAQAVKRTADAKKAAEQNAAQARSSQGSGQPASRESESTKELSGGSLLAENNASKNPAPPTAVGAVPPPPSNPNPTAEAKTATDNKSAAEWLSLLSTHGTTQLVQEFETAHQDREVSDADFYQVAFELFNSQTPQTQQIGTEVLQDDTSQAELLQLAQHYASESTALQTTLWNMMLTFAQPTKFAGLDAALASSSAAVVTLSMKVLTSAVQTAQQELTTQGTGSTTRGVAGTVQPSSLKEFETELTSISKAGGTNAATAQSLLSQIESLNQ